MYTAGSIQCAASMSVGTITGGYDGLWSRANSLGYQSAPGKGLALQRGASTDRDFHYFNSGVGLQPIHIDAPCKPKRNPRPCHREIFQTRNREKRKIRPSPCRVLAASLSVLHVLTALHVLHVLALSLRAARADCAARAARATRTLPYLMIFAISSPEYFALTMAMISLGIAWGIYIDGLEPKTRVKIMKISIRTGIAL